MSQRKTPLSGSQWQSVADWKGQTIAGMVVTGFHEHTIKIKRYGLGGRPLLRDSRDDTASGYCPCSPDILRSAQVSKLKTMQKKGEEISCQICKPLGKRSSQGKKKAKKASDPTLFQSAVEKLKKLPKDQQAKVAEMARQHTSTLKRLRVPEGVDHYRVLVEAMELVEKSDTLPPNETPKYEPERRYRTYESPREL